MNSNDIELKRKLLVLYKSMDACYFILWSVSFLVHVL